jgi:hypothetical protein
MVGEDARQPTQRSTGDHVVVQPGFPMFIVDDKQ